MAIIKEFREFFLRHVQVNTGLKKDQEVGYGLNYIVQGIGTVFNRFLKNDYPSEDVFKKLFESLTFKLNTEDTATYINQGLVRKATDTEAVARTNNGINTFTNVVVPNQLSDVVLLLDGNDVVQGTPLDLNGLKLSLIERTVAGLKKLNFKVEVIREMSIIIDPTTKKLRLSGDVDAPGNNLVYGTSALGVKGWYSISGLVSSIVTGLFPTYTFIESSVLLTGVNITLVNDQITPGNNYYYGTNSSGVKGWYMFPSYKLAKVYNANPGVNVNVLFTEINLDSFSIPANTLQNIGDEVVYTIHTKAYEAFDGVGMIKERIRIGAILLYFFDYLNIPNFPETLNITITTKISYLGSSQANVFIEVIAVSESNVRNIIIDNTHQVITVNPAIVNTISVTGEKGSNADFEIKNSTGVIGKA